MAGTNITIKLEESAQHPALPVLNLVNTGMECLKSGIQNGERGITAKKAGAYLGYRLLSYLPIPLLTNLISAVVSAILYVVTLPTRCCTKSINDWCWTRLKGSGQHLYQNIVEDLTYDLRQLCNRTPAEA